MYYFFISLFHVYFVCLFHISCLNFWDEAWWFLSLRMFGLLSSCLLLFPQHSGRYVFRPSSGVCCLNFWLLFPQHEAWWFFIIKDFRTIVFMFIVISTTFRPICLPAFFMCLLSEFLDEAIKDFWTIVFIFVVISTTFRPLCLPAFWAPLVVNGYKLD